MKALPSPTHSEEHLQFNYTRLLTLRSFYGWLRRSNGYPMNQPLPTDAIDLEREPEAQADHIELEELVQIKQALALDKRTAIRDRAIIAVLSHGLRASELEFRLIGKEKQPDHRFWLLNGHVASIND